MKLSQIPLNHMLECAVAAGAPLKKPPPAPGVHNPFAIHPDLERAYAAFISQATLAPRPIYEWLQSYLDWRWQMHDHFAMSNQVKRAERTEKDILIAWNNRLISDAAAMMRSDSMSLGKRTFAALKDVFYSGARKDLMTTSFLEPEAREVLALARRAKPAPPSFVALFDDYVHDSLAGFDRPKCELTGYWRYRRVFLGDDEHAVAANQDMDAASNIA